MIDSLPKQMLELHGSELPGFSHQNPKSQHVCSKKNTNGPRHPPKKNTCSKCGLIWSHFDTGPFPPKDLSCFVRVILSNCNPEIRILHNLLVFFVEKSPPSREVASPSLCHSWPFCDSKDERCRK